MDHLSTPRVAVQQSMDATPTTDYALIESQKENIRPLASGRSAATLSSLFEKNEAEKVIQEGHLQHQKNIEEAERRDREGEEMMDGFMDLLDVYNRYILFTVQHHPTSASHLVPLLESTSRRFIDDARYSQDIRNLKMWVMYTRHVERREEIFAYLESKDVGTKHALFYEEWATAVEGLGRKKKADEIYRLGINRRAAPVERLRSRHQAFLARIMAPPGGEIPEDDLISSSSRPSSRSILGQVASTPSSSLSGATQLAPSTRVSRPNNGSKMEIFADTAGDAQHDPAGEWADFGTRDGRRKENVIEATPWKGETLPQKRIAPRTPKMEVFKDTTDNEAVRATPADEVFARRAQNSEAEQLKADPLRNFDTSSLSNNLPALPPPPSVRKAPRPRSHYVMQPWECPKDGPEVKDAKGKVQRRMFDWNATFKNNEEWSFEEVRARQRGLLGKEWRGEVKEWERQWHVPGSSTPKREEKRRKVPSPTVNTKLANEEVAMMFDQTIHGGRVRDSDSESDDDSGSSDEEEVAVAIPPTPLPAPGSMMRPVAGMVPPTPTPAQGLGRSAPMAVFADENAGVPQSAKKFNIFSETPAKTPLAARTPVASSSKPRAFGIFTDDENADSYIQATPSLKPRAPLGSVNVFATPAVGEKIPARRALAMAIPEESEEAEEQYAVEGAGEVVEEFININDEEDDEEPPFHRRGVSQAGMLTPIVERTCEYTSVSQMSALRSSTSNSTTSRRISTASVATGIINEEEGQAIAAPPSTAPAGLSAVIEEDERSGSLPPQSARSSPRTSLSSMFQSPSGNHSGRVGAGFALPEGFTIHARPQFAEGADHDSRRREGSIEREEFVTAEHGQADFVTAEQGCAGLPNPCNPVDDDVIAELLSTMDPPLSSISGFIDYRSSAFSHLDTLQKHSKSKVRRNSGASSRVSIAPEEGYALTLVDKEFEVRDKIGEGGFGAVFLGVDVQMRQALDERDDDEDSDDEDEGAEDKCLVAIKVERPAAVWEGVVLDRLHRRLDEKIRQSIIRSRSLYAFADESYLLLDFSAQGTLLDVVNKATSMGIAPATAGAQSSLDELLAVFFTTELLRTVEALHRANFIHGDLKIDNCLVRLEETPNSAWSNAYDRSGGSGWSKKGVKLIDFGRAIDLSLFPNNGRQQKFVADWKMDERDCVEMREGQEWNFETDYWGLASIAYCMLFGKYIGTEVAGGKYKIDQPLRRYWQADLWNALFDLLLNPKAVSGDLPVTNELAKVREKFEVWLEDNCQKGGKNLKSMLKKIELAAITSARRA